MWAGVSRTRLRATVTGSVAGNVGQDRAGNGGVGERGDAGYLVAQPSAAPANDRCQLAGALHGQTARSNERRISDLREPGRGSPGSVIHAIAQISSLSITDQ